MEHPLLIIEQIFVMHLLQEHDDSKNSMKLSCHSDECQNL